MRVKCTRRQVIKEANRNVQHTIIDIDDEPIKKTIFYHINIAREAYFQNFFSYITSLGK